MESVIERFEKARKEKAIIVDYGTPFQRMVPPEPARIAASLSESKLPVPVKAPVKRARKFEVRKVPWRSLELALFLVGEVNGQAAAAVSNENLFREFMALNDTPTGTVPRDFLLLLYAVDITLQGMAATSVRTMMRGIMGICSRAQDPIEGPLVGDMFKILNLIIANEEVDHAKDMELGVALEIIGRLSGMAQVIAWFMLICGARVADLERMFRRQFLFQLNWMDP